MPKISAKQLHVYDFTVDELSTFLASVQENARHSMIVPGEGRVRERTARRVEQTMRDSKVDSTAKLPTSDQPSGLHVSLPVDKKMLDDWLRKEIDDLPPIGQYVAVQPPRSPDVALRVRWETDDSKPQAKGKS